MSDIEDEESDTSTKFDDEEDEEDSESDQDVKEVDDEYQCDEAEKEVEKVIYSKILTPPQYIDDFHPQEKSIPYKEVMARCTVERDDTLKIIDDRHTSLPFLTKYEYTRILGMRATQIENGAPLFTTVPDSLIDSYLIAKQELHEKVIPFIVTRPLPNGTIEYWAVGDLELLF